MKIAFKSIPIVIFLTLIGTSVMAQDFTLKDRSVLELNMGLWGQSKASSTTSAFGTKAEARTSAFVGGILYAYGLQEQVAVTLSAGLLSAQGSTNASAQGFNQQGSVVMPFLIGVRYYVPTPEPGAKVRPFLSLAAGSYIGLEGSNTALSQESQTESTFGGRVGLGIDIYMSNYVKLVANAGYNFMSDFSTPIGARSNYNGGEMSLGIGYAF